jgi:hypothetical protein
MQDPRYRSLLFLNTYLLQANLYRVDAITPLVEWVMWEDHCLSTHKLYYDNNLDCVYSIGSATSRPIHNWMHNTIGYTEMVPVTVNAIDPVGSNSEGTRTLWTCEQELRRIVETYFGGELGVLRRFESITPETTDMGGWKLYKTKNNLEYQRINSNYTPTYPCFSYGIPSNGTLELDRLTGGVEGTWTLTQGAGSTCAQTITSDKNLLLTQTVFGADSSTVNGTNLGLSSTTYGRIRIRYKTSGSATAKVILGFSSGTQTVLSESASPNGLFTVVDVAITASKTINTITLYCCDGIGTVTYDFIQIYTGNYIIPIVTKMDPSAELKDAIIEIPGMSGNYTQGLGSGLKTVTMECLLDLEPAALTWKRPQTASSKTDANNTDVFDEIWHYMGINTAWTWLKLGYPAKQFKARLVKPQPSYAEDNVLTLAFREYRHGHANSESVIERFGMNLT